MLAKLDILVDRNMTEHARQEKTQLNMSIGQSVGAACRNRKAVTPQYLRLRSLKYLWEKGTEGPMAPCAKPNNQTLIGT